MIWVPLKKRSPQSVHKKLKSGNFLKNTIVEMSPLHSSNWSGNNNQERDVTARNTILISIITLLITFGFAAPTVSADDDLWDGLKQTYFGDREIRENADDLLVLEAPTRAEDAAIVPISVKSLQPQTADSYIKNLHLIIDRNPMPYSANFHLSPQLGKVDLATRVRIDQYTNMRAIAEMNDGSLHMVTRFIKASGGCSAPAGKDMAAAMARLGKMQLGIREATIGE